MTFKIWSHHCKWICWGQTGPNTTLMLAVAVCCLGWLSLLSIQTPNIRTASDIQGSGGMESPSTNELCIKLITDFMNRRIGKVEAVQEILQAFWESSAHDNISAVQIQTATAVYILMLNQAKSAWGDAAHWEVQQDEQLEHEPEVSYRTVRTASVRTEWTPEPEMSLTRAIDGSMFI